MWDQTLQLSGALQVPDEKGEPRGWLVPALGLKGSESSP